MSLQSRRELLGAVGPRYRAAGRREKGQILDEFVRASGYRRDYAVTLLNHPPPKRPPVLKRARKRRYGAEEQRVLSRLWEASSGLCGKRLVAGLPDLLEALEQHEGWSMDPQVRARVLGISPATADRLLAPARRGQKPIGLSTTRPGTLLKHQVPIRTFADWDEQMAGFVEADLVAHCGETTAGEYLNTLNLTDIQTGWTDFEALRNRSQASVCASVHAIRRRLPFALLGLDTDNGSEFINHTLLRYCNEEMITLSRGRPANKNDQCFIEQKNFSVVRKTVGYARLDGEACWQALSGFYGSLRLYVNFFQPSMKLLSKDRQGAKVRKAYDRPLTPYRRVLARKEVPEWIKAKLTSQYQTLNPAELLRQMECWRTRLSKAVETWNHK